MMETADSIKEYGVLVPAIVRPDEKGGYEIISGHRRKRGCELAGKETLPAIVRNLDDDKATIIMVDSNIQRENLLPSERAFAYKMKLEAIKHQGMRSDLTSAQVEQKSSCKTSIQLIAEQSGESRSKIQRYIRLTNLIPELLEMVDIAKMALSPAVELSYLKKQEQKWLLTEIELTEATPSLSQAQRLKKTSQAGKLNEDIVCAIMSEDKKDYGKVTLSGEQIRKYFPKSYTPRQIENTIIKLLEVWQKKRQHTQNR